MSAPQSVAQRSFSTSSSIDELHGRVADVGVDLHVEVAADDHRLELGVVDVGGDDGAAARDLAPHELGRHPLAERDELHLLGDLAPAGVAASWVTGAGAAAAPGGGGPSGTSARIAAGAPAGVVDRRAPESTARRSGGSPSRTSKPCGPLVS